MKLLNFICECGEEKEELYSSEEIKELKEVICEKCGKAMKPFNFKNNCQAWRDTV